MSERWRDWRMRLVVISVVLTFGMLAAAEESLRTVDFRNFTYPLSGSRLGHDRLVWLDTNAPGSLRLKNGKGQSGFSLSSVSFADVTGDGRQDAIVVIHYGTGGTQQTDYIYLYAPSPAGPRLLAYCRTGDRAYSGLQKVYGEHEQLVVELSDPAKMEADCCSAGIVRTRYVWRNERFQIIGAPEHEAASVLEHKEE